MNHDELLWKYIDGDCTPEEANRVEQRLAEDPAFKREWAQRLKLHQSLQQQELEHPPLRFARNLMDRLPRLYRKPEISPLISPFWRKALSGVAGAFLMAYFALVFNVIEATGPAGNSGLPWLEDFMQAATSVPAQAMSIVLALSVGYILLSFTDRKLKERFR